jgi:hypothetical protein
LLYAPNDQEEYKVEGASGYAMKNQMMSSRFDPNNKELNKRRFEKQNANILNVKNKKNKGAKFVNKEIEFTLTPQDEDMAILEN